MVEYHQQQAPTGVNPPLTQSYPPSSQGPYVTAPPPMGYPVKDGPEYPYGQAAPTAQTQSRGSDGFLRGCLAALCCCWIVDVCIC